MLRQDWQRGGEAARRRRPGRGRDVLLGGDRRQRRHGLRMVFSLPGKPPDRWGAPDAGTALYVCGIQTGCSRRRNGSRPLPAEALASRWCGGWAQGLRAMSVHRHCRLRLSGRNGSAEAAGRRRGSSTAPHRRGFRTAAMWRGSGPLPGVAVILRRTGRPEPEVSYGRDRFRAESDATEPGRAVPRRPDSGHEQLSRSPEASFGGCTRAVTDALRGGGRGTSAGQSGRPLTSLRGRAGTGDRPAAFGRRWRPSAVRRGGRRRCKSGGSSQNHRFADDIPIRG